MIKEDKPVTLEIKEYLVTLKDMLTSSGISKTNWELSHYLSGASSEALEVFYGDDSLLHLESDLIYLEKRKLALAILSLLLQDKQNMLAFLELSGSPHINGPVSHLS